MYNINVIIIISLGIILDQLQSYNSDGQAVDMSQL